MFYREPCISQARVAEQYRPVFYSRPRRGRAVHGPGVGRRTVCGVKRGTNGRVAGGFRRCTEYTLHRYTVYDGKQSVGYVL